MGIKIVSGQQKYKCKLSLQVTSLAEFAPWWIIWVEFLATPFQAFGRTGDLETAFELIDEMRQNHVPVTHETFDFLLQGCISDKEVGFRHALITWRMMRQKQVWPR